MAKMKAIGDALENIVKVPKGNIFENIVKVPKGNISRYAAKSRVGKSKFGSIKNPNGAGYIKTDLSKISSLADIDATSNRWMPYETVFGSSKPKQSTQKFNGFMSKPQSGYMEILIEPNPRKNVSPREKTKANSYNAFGRGNKNFNSIDVNRSEGFVKTVSDNANKILDSNLSKVADDLTGLTSFGKGNKNFNSIDVNRGEGFVKTVLNNANKILDSDLGKAADDLTGLTSFGRGFGKAGEEFTGNRLSKAAQNAGYIKKNAAGELDVNYKKIAAGYMGASAIARVATGGGLYKDGQGNTNVIGLPII